MELVGRTISQYRIVEEIGRGGAAVVYKAWQPSLGRYVALKVLLPHLQHDPGFVTRFQREARSAASLDHPNIVRIYDAGEGGGYSYIAMEYVEGQSLHDRLADRQAPLALTKGVRIVSEIASALDYAHQKGIVHRDVKPGNVLLATDGRAVLTDFGIARASEGSRLTLTGMGPGTPGFMSPEQVEGRAVDARSDTYALGLVAYYVLTGQPAFQATTPHAALYAQVHEMPPRPSRRNPALSRSVDLVVFRALAKSPAKRYRTAGEFAEALRRATAREPAGPRVSPWPARIWIGAAAGVLIVVSLLVWSPWRRPATPTPIATTITSSQIRPTARPTRTVTLGPPSATPRHTVTSIRTGRTSPSPPPPSDGTPVVSILAPTNGTLYQVGDRVQIYYRAEDDLGLDRVQLRVNGQPAGEAIAMGTGGEAACLSWQPSVAGEYHLDILAVDIIGQPGTSGKVRIMVSDATPTSGLSSSRVAAQARVSCGFGSSACQLGWDYAVPNARYRVSNGQLSFEVMRRNTVGQLYLRQYRLSDFTIEVKVRQHSGAASGACGLIFRHQDHRNTYRFSINGKGQFEIGKEHNNRWHYLSGYSGLRASSALKAKGEWNTLKVVCSGNRVTAYVNGTEVVSATDSTFGAGHVGLLAGTEAGNSLGVFFKDLNVHVP